MSYRALYRVFRPQTFAEVIGQEHISTTLLNALKNNRLAHAYLFCGPRGTGKTSSAKILAKAVNCLSPIEGEPCNNCANCQAINHEQFMDVLEIDAASNRGIDEIREIRDKVKFAPSEGKRKVYIIDEVHMLTNEAFNALLKTLEEPPEHVLFILATTDPQKIPLTVLSRCQRFDFRKIGTAEIRAHLAEIVNKEQVAINDDALDAIARRASGGMRDAISILDQCIAFAGERVEVSHVQMVLGTLGEEDMLNLFACVLQNDYGRLFEMVSDFLARGKDIKQIVRDLMEYARQLLLLKVAPQEQLLMLSAEVLPKAKSQTAQMTVEFLGEAINRLSQLEKDIKFSNQPQILLEAALVDLILLKANPHPRTAAAVPPPQETPAPKSQPAEPAKPKKQLLSAQEIISQWSQVMQAVKRASIRIHAFLLPAEPKGFENEALVLKFPSESKFHYDQLNLGENKQVLEDVLAKISGKTVKVQLFLEAEQGAFEREYSLSDDCIKVFGTDKVEIID